MRNKFITEVNKRRNASSSQQSRQERSSNQNYSSSTSSQNKAGNMGIGAVIIGCLAIIPFIITKSDPPSKFTDKSGKEVSIQEQAGELKVKDYSENDLNRIHLNTQKIKAKPLEKFYNDILKKRPHMLAYPTGEDPDIFDQLIKYSIAPDIHLYEVSSKYFLNKEDFDEVQQLKTVENIPKYEMKEVKPNTLLSLSLEAERALQNVYIKVDDILEEIEEKGKYTPPKVMFKFKGYIMAEIRDKPFSTLQCFRNTKYISLFDLYFDFYSPVFFKRSYFNMYLTGFNDDSNEARKNTRYFGNVHLNNHSIPCRYIEKD